MGKREACPGVRRVYVFGPFALDSDLALPELTSIPESASATIASLIRVRIRVGDFVIEGRNLVEIDPWISASSTELLLTIPEVARFLAREGREVLIVPEPEAAEVDLRLYLLGSVFGALCHQNGLLPLHASAIVHQGRVTAFLGESGAGKSTLAAFLARRGYTVVADDICLLERREDESLAVIPVAGWLKLWRTSLDGLGQRPTEALRVVSDEDKYRVYLSQPANGTAENARLACVVLLERPEGEGNTEAPQVLSISPGVVVAELMNMTYLPELTERPEEREAHFHRCAHVANQVRAVRLIAPLGWDRMDEVLDLIQRELLNLPHA